MIANEVEMPLDAFFFQACIIDRFFNRYHESPMSSCPSLLLSIQSSDREDSTCTLVISLETGPEMQPWLTHSIIVLEIRLIATERYSHA
jgi:hypothetical protein